MLLGKWKSITKTKSLESLRNVFVHFTFGTLLIWAQQTDGARNRGIRHRFEQFGLNCFTCVSINGTDKDCDDPVQEAWMNPTQDCKAPVAVDFNQTEYEHLNETIKEQYEYFAERTWKKERANFCLKVVGTSESKESIVIRTCIMEDMNSQCGSFTFRGRKIRGCMLTCNDHLCNGAASNGFPFNMAYQHLFDHPYAQDNSLIKIILGLKLATVIPAMVIAGFVFLGSSPGDWRMDNIGMPSYLYAGG